MSLREPRLLVIVLKFISPKKKYRVFQNLKDILCGPVPDVILNQKCLIHMGPLVVGTEVRVFTVNRMNWKRKL